MPSLTQSTAMNPVLSVTCLSRRDGDLAAAVGAESAKPQAANGRAYWRSVEEMADSPEFRQKMHDEFAGGAMDLLDSGERRHFLRIMGASMALAGVTLTGCRRWPKENIEPYAHRPEDRTPGVPEHFATTCETAGVATGLLVTSFDGRPIKIEGNPEHPTSRGSTDLFMQASVLDMYDPDRSQHFLNKAKRSEAQAFAAWATPHFSGLRGRRGKGLFILSEAVGSPSVLDMKARLLSAMPDARWLEYEPLVNDNQVRGSIFAFGSPQRSHWMLDQAKVIVALDADFLFDHPAAVKLIRDFASGRRMDNNQSECARLYAFEGAFSLTGANADHRFAMRSADIGLVAAALLGRIAPNRLSGAAAAEALKALDATLPEDWNGQTYSKVVDAVAADLKGNRGQCLVVAGPRQPAEVHVLVHVLNEELGNTGKTVAYSPLTPGPTNLEAIAALSDEMKAGHVDTLVIIGGNPVYNAPADLGFAEALQRVPNSVHLGAYPDETAALCTWHVPRAHYLESWGDGRAWDGTVSVCQPLIEPLFGGRSAIELLAQISGDEKTAGYDIVRRTFAAEFTNADRFEKDWRKTLHDGVLASASKMQWQLGASPRGGLQAGAAGDAVQRLAKRGAPASGDSFELIFTPDTHAYDGRFTNNGWLMEMPDPMTKLTWDNAVVIGYGAAKRLNVRTGDRVRITAAGGLRSMEAAVQMIPGVHDRVAVLSLGFGRAFPGRVCKDAGFNFYQLRTSDAMGFAAGATLQKTDGTYPLATTQDHHTIDVDTVGGQGVQDRLGQLYREADLEEYQHHPDFARHRAHVVHRLSLWDENMPFQSADGFPGARHAWAMSIDLSACVGCGACMIACQAENNIPVVGKDQVIRGREMQWIRLDRYFKFKKSSSGTEGGPAYDPSAVEQAALQPVTCMHCENAPCEQVCPVAATVHDADGLNVMAYNRCIGTRYCSNNCPYKVRRFNYFDYQCREPVRETGMWFVEPEYYIEPQSDTPPLQRMQFNPEVTVRSRGVMEKCTYCTQRITKAKIDAKNKAVRQATATGRAVSPDPIRIDDGEVTPACAQACPAQAIVFGDLLNPASQVLKAHRHERSYGMLDDINTKPRTKYLARIRNPNPELVPPAPDGDHDHDHGHAQPEASKHG